VDDAGPRRHDAQVPERGLRPAQQLVALAVALVLALDVEGERVARAEPVDLDGVVDDEVGRHQRVDTRRVAPEVGHGVAHDRQVHDGGHPGEVLHDHPGRHERDLGLGDGARPPRRQRLDVAPLDDAASRVAQQVLEEDPDGHRQLAIGGDVADGAQPIDVREARRQRRPSAEGVIR
jgi:hypothetical protein